jgi:hypothetical protein
MNSYKKIDKKGFYCSSDTVYFNSWTKLFILSAKQYAPWAHIHVHIFDPIESDYDWCNKNNISISSEITPTKYTETIDTKKGYWVNMRFVRLAELYSDSTSVISVDSDSLFVQKLTEYQFDADLKTSWVTIARRGKSDASLGSAVGFGLDNVRHIFREKLLKHADNLRWFLDQEILDNMLKDNLIGNMNTKYTDFKYGSESYIWSGKGNRKLKKTFITLAEEYRKGLIQ